MFPTYGAIPGCQALCPVPDILVLFSPHNNPGRLLTPFYTRTGGLREGKCFFQCHKVLSGEARIGTQVPVPAGLMLSTPAGCEQPC